MFDRVVVAWDGSAAAESALDWVLERPGLRTLRVLRVIEPGRGSHGAPDGHPAACAELNELVDRICARCDRAAVEGVLLEGTPEREITRSAVRGSLLVLGVKRRPGGPAAGDGLAARVALTSAGPVALVPDGASRRSGEVVVGIDGSGAAAAAAEIAAGEAVDRRTAVIAVHVRGESAGTRIALDRLADEAGGLTGRFPHLLVRARAVRGDPAVELARAGAGASVLVLGRHDPPDHPDSVALDLVTRVGVPTIVVGEADGLAPLPRFRAEADLRTPAPTSLAAPSLPSRL